MRCPALALCAILTAGCAGAPKATPALPTDGLGPTRAALAAVECLAEILEPVVPDSDQARDVWLGLGTSVAAGYALCDAWEDAGEAPSSWRDWTMRVLELIERISVVLTDAGVPVPSYVGIAVGAVKILLPILAGVL